jgi:hypothetical protein
VKVADECGEEEEEEEEEEEGTMDGSTKQRGLGLS